MCKTGKSTFNLHSTDNPERHQSLRIAKQPLKRQEYHSLFGQEGGSYSAEQLSSEQPLQKPRPRATGMGGYPRATGIGAAVGVAQPSRRAEQQSLATRACAARRERPFLQIAGPVSETPATARPVQGAQQTSGAGQGATLTLRDGSLCPGGCHPPGLLGAQREELACSLVSGPASSTGSWASAR